MQTKALPVALGAVLALGIVVTTHAGGWAVVTVEDLPEQLVVGKATAIVFSVRQHGQRLVPGLTAGIVANSGRRTVEAIAAAKQPGYYAATLTLPAPGEWSLTIHSGFMTSNVTLLPIRAVADGQNGEPVPGVKRGEQLFVAKGCASCHSHGRIAAKPIAPIGADLTDKRYSDVLLSRILEDPSMLPAAESFGMPNLGLRPKEIAALVAFINRPTTRP